MPVAAEAISPELVLVCPELRDRALLLAEPIWETVAREVRTRAAVSTLPRRRTALAASATTAFLRFVIWQVAVVLAVGGATLILTLVADALRQPPALAAPPHSQMSTEVPPAAAR